MVTPRRAGKHDINIFPEIKENQNTCKKLLMATSNGHWLLEISIIIFREVLFGLFFFLIIIFCCFVVDPTPFYLQSLYTLSLSTHAHNHVFLVLPLHVLCPGPADPFWGGFFSSPVADHCILRARVRYFPGGMLAPCVVKACSGFTFINVLGFEASQTRSCVSFLHFMSCIHSDQTLSLGEVFGLNLLKGTPWAQGREQNSILILESTLPSFSSFLSWIEGIPVLFGGFDLFSSGTVADGALTPWLTAPALKQSLACLVILATFRGHSHFFKLDRFFKI